MTDPFANLDSDAQAAQAAAAQLQQQLAAAQQALAAETAKENADQALIAQLQAQLAALQPTGLPWPFTGYAPPAGTGVSQWADLGDDTLGLQAAMQKLGKHGNYLVLAGHPYIFPMDLTNPLAYIAALRLFNLGLYGAADASTVIQAQPNSLVANPNGTNSANKAMDADQSTSFQRLAGLTFVGSDQGGTLYNGVQMSGPDASIEHCLFRGFGRGTDNKPPHETGNLTSWSANRLVIRNVEIDCRDPQTGLPVSTSPIMLNSSDDVLLEDVYAHDSVKGTITNWAGGTAVTKATYRRVRSINTDNGLNFERHNDGAQILIEDCELKPRAGGAHLQANSDRGSGKFLVKNPTIDGGVFKVRIWPTYGTAPQKQQRADITVVDGNGAPIPITWL